MTIADARKSRERRERNSFLTPLIVKVLPNGKTFEIHEPFTYSYRQGTPMALTIAIKAGFVTDFASIPWGANLIIRKLGRHTKASVIHDYLYQNHSVTNGHVTYTFTRKQADRIFLVAMEELGVAPWKRRSMWVAVRLAGWLAWNGVEL